MSRKPSAFRGSGVDLLDELGLLLAGRLDLELLGLLAQLGDLHGREFLARKRGLGGGGITLLVALFAIALAVTTVVVALVLAVAAVVIALVLATVGASAVFGLGGRGAIGCGGVGIGRSGVHWPRAGIDLRFDISLPLGRLGLSGLLTTALGLLGRRLVRRPWDSAASIDASAVVSAESSDAPFLAPWPWTCA